MRTNPPVELAPETSNLLLSAEALDLKIRSLRLYRDVYARPELRQGMARKGLSGRLHRMLRTDGQRGAAIIAQDCVDLIVADGTPEEVEQILAFPRAVAEDVFSLKGSGGITLLQAELAEAVADVVEDGTQADFIVSLAAGKKLSDQELDERLRHVRRAAAANSVLLRALEGEQRKRALGLFDRRAS